jgi:hypothetical protein
MWNTLKAESGDRTLLGRYYQTFPDDHELLREKMTHIEKRKETRIRRKVVKEKWQDKVHRKLGI